MGSPLPLLHPFTAIVSGPTGCGKTQFTMRLIKERQEKILPSPERIVWCYGIYQKEFDSLQKSPNNVEFYDGLPNLNMFDGLHRILLIIDDFMHETDAEVSQIFTKGSHHKNISVIYLSQNLFYGGNRQNRTISLNTHYLIVFKNPRDAMQISHLARQMYPGKKAKHMIEAFADATVQPYTYLFIDLKPNTDDRYRLRTNIFSDEKQYVYLPK